ncbi:hypothetical protein PspLS_09649 [Pyricularia sp. CBS 133598]|nr:hypothetical protein PspLS_09649 [Pyricularia sp. CBS 133598]
MVDLWLTPFDPDIGVEFSLLIKRKSTFYFPDLADACKLSSTREQNQLTPITLNLTTEGIDLSKRSPDHLWTIEGIPLNVLRRTPKFVLRFTPEQKGSNPQFNRNDPELSSKGFFVVQGAENESKPGATEMTTKSRATETAVSSMTTSQLTLTSTNSPPPKDAGGQSAAINSEDQAGLGIGPIAGTAAGSLAVLTLAIGLSLWCLCFRRRGTVRTAQLRRDEGLSMEYMVSPPRGGRSDAFYLDQTKDNGTRLSELTTAIPTAELEDKHHTSKSRRRPETFGRAELFQIIFKNPKTTARMSSFTMDRGQNSSLMDRHQAAITDITKHFGELVIGLSAPVTAEDADTATSAQQAMRMQLESNALIASIEHLLSLTRQVRELWLVGPLLKPGEGERAADGQIDEQVESMTKILNELRERVRNRQVGPHGTYVIKDRAVLAVPAADGATADASSSAAPGVVDEAAFITIIEMCDGDLDLFLQLFQELTRRPGAAGLEPPTAVEVNMDEIRMMEDAFNSVPSDQMEDINPDIADEALFWRVMEEEREANLHSDAAQNTDTAASSIQQVSGQDVTLAEEPLAFQNQAGATAQDHGQSASAFGSTEINDQGDAQSVGDPSSDIPMLDIPMDPEGRRLEYLLSQDHGLIDHLLPVICPSGSVRDAEAMGSQLFTIDEE